MSSTRPHESLDELVNRRADELMTGADLALPALEPEPVNASSMTRQFIDLTGDASSSVPPELSDRNLESPTSDIENRVEVDRELGNLAGPMDIDRKEREIKVKIERQPFETDDNDSVQEKKPIVLMGIENLPPIPDSPGNRGVPRPAPPGAPGAPGKLLSPDEENRLSKPGRQVVGRQEKKRRLNGDGERYRSREEREEYVDTIYATAPGLLVRVAESISGICRLTVGQLLRPKKIYKDQPRLYGAAKWRPFMNPVLINHFYSVLEMIQSEGSPTARNMKWEQLVQYYEFATWVGLRIILTQQVNMKTWTQKGVTNRVNSGIAQVMYFFANLR